MLNDALNILVFYVLGMVLKLQLYLMEAILIMIKRVLMIEVNTISMSILK